MINFCFKFATIVSTLYVDVQTTQIRPNCTTIMNQIQNNNFVTIKLSSIPKIQRYVTYNIVIKFVHSYAEPMFITREISLNVSSGPVISRTKRLHRD